MFNHSRQCLLRNETLFTPSNSFCFSFGSSVLLFLFRLSSDSPLRPPLRLASSTTTCSQITIPACRNVPDPTGSNLPVRRSAVLLRVRDTNEVLESHDDGCFLTLLFTSLSILLPTFSLIFLSPLPTFSLTLLSPLPTPCPPPTAASSACSAGTIRLGRRTSPCTGSSSRDFCASSPSPSWSYCSPS